MSELRISLGQSKVRPRGGRYGNFRTGSHSAYHLCLTEAGRSLASFAMFKENVGLLFPKNLGAESGDANT